MLKTMYGDAATKADRLGFRLSPEGGSAITPGVYLWDNMYNGIVKGLFAFGMNGVAIGPTIRKEQLKH